MMGRTLSAVLCCVTHWLGGPVLECFYRKGARCARKCGASLISVRLPRGDSVLESSLRKHSLFSTLREFNVSWRWASHCGIPVGSAIADIRSICALDKPESGTHARARGSVNQIRKDLCVRLLTGLPAGRPGVLVFGGVGSCHLFVAV